MTSSTEESALESEADRLTHVAKSQKMLKCKRQATSPSRFGAGLEALLEMASGMPALLSLKPGLRRWQKGEKLECGARKLLEGEKKEQEEKGRIRDVIGGWGVEREHALWNSVGEVRSGPIPVHFCWTGDQTVQSLTKFLGPGLGLPRTIYIGLDPVQTRSLHILFIYLFKIEDGRLVWDSAVPTCSAYRGLGGGNMGEAVDGGRPG